MAKILTYQTALRPPFHRSAGSEVWYHKLLTPSWYSTQTEIHSPQILEYHGLRSIQILANSLALIIYISVYIHCFGGDIYI